MDNENWKLYPTSIEELTSETPYILALDESGTAELKSVERNGINLENKWFILSGAIFDINSFEKNRKIVADLKNKYWNNGTYTGKRVVLHAREIRKHMNCFNKKYIDYDKFIIDLADVIEHMDFKTIIMASDKVKFFNRYYPNVHPLYEELFSYILERYSFFLNSYFNKSRKKGEVMFESRNEKEDQEVLSKAVNVYENGTYYVDSSKFKSINGIHFNKKRTADNKKSYYMLEIADIMSYTVLRYLRDKEKNEIFDALKPKIITDRNGLALGYGFKFFPSDCGKFQ